jgi:hypothetical protein
MENTNETLNKSDKSALHNVDNKKCMGFRSSNLSTYTELN